MHPNHLPPHIPSAIHPDVKNNGRPQGGRCLSQHRYRSAASVAMTMIIIVIVIVVIVIVVALDRPRILDVPLRPFQHDVHHLEVRSFSTASRCRVAFYHHHVGDAGEGSDVVRAERACVIALPETRLV